jgi:hypothetical protein
LLRQHVSKKKHLVACFYEHARDHVSTSLSSRKGTQLLRRLGQLPRDQQIDFATVIFVIGEALVNLRASNIGKTVRDRIDCFAVLQKGDHVVHTDACSFDPRVTAANSLCLHDIAIIRRRSIWQDYITARCKIDIRTRTRIALIHTNNCIGLVAIGVIRVFPSA